MSRPLRIARVTVTSWPTPTGGPWWSYVANDGGELANWLESLPAKVTHDFEITESSGGLQYVMGWKLPRPDRRHYLSASAARRWAAAARRLGALVDVELSDPVVWSQPPEPDGAERIQGRTVQDVELPAPAQVLCGVHGAETCQCWTSPF